MRTFVIGNINGHYEELMQCFELADFNYNEDRLIVTGDVTDFGPCVAECVSELLKVKYRKIVASGHDTWFYEWLLNEKHPDNWMTGGTMTLISYLKFVGKSTKISAHGNKITHLLKPSDIPEDHWMYFMKRIYIFKDYEHRLYVSSGIDPMMTREGNMKAPHTLCWDKALWHKLAIQKIPVEFVENFDELYISSYGVYESLKKEEPVKIGKVWNIGTSFRNAGRLCLMNVDTKEYYLSEQIHAKQLI